MNYRIEAGIDNIKANKCKITIPIGYMLLIIITAIYIKHTIINEYIPLMPDWIYYVGIAAIIITGLLYILSLLGTPKEAKQKEEDLSKIWIGTATSETPHLVSVLKEKKIITYIFYSKQITLSEYHDKQEKIETALNKQILSIEQGKDKRHTVIKCVSAKAKLPDRIEWEDEYISQKDFELVLGVSQLGQELIDLNILHHILIAGGTGSGKSILAKTLIKQCILKGANVYIADFKGGADYFSRIWQDNCEIVTTIEEFEDMMEKIMEIYEKRKNLFARTGYREIKDYNTENDPLPRIIIVCDEFAELIERKALNKTEKARIEKIESNLNTLTRQGRFLGFHLILVTQRPSAEIVNGQIKGNTSLRICGRADDILSNIVLGNHDAADKIPQNGQGMFVTNYGRDFKAYYMDE